MTGGSYLFSLQALAPPEEIRRKAQEIISRPDYELDSPQDSESGGILTRILMWVLEKLQAFFEAMAGLPDVLRWAIVVVLFVALVVLVSHILVTFLRALRGVPRRRSAAFHREQFLLPEDLEHAAEQSQAEGDYIQAVRQLFLAALLRIERAEDRPLRKGITNRELLRRYRSTPLFGSLARFANVIDSKWYGHDICREEDYLDCRDEYARIRGITERRRHAVSA